MSEISKIGILVGLLLASSFAVLFVGTITGAVIKNGLDVVVPLAVGSLVMVCIILIITALIIYLKLNYQRTGVPSSPYRKILSTLIKFKD